MGPLQCVVNMGPALPPQHKGHLPQYASDKLVELQEKFDHLENVGVFKRPEDLGIIAEYVNPSFLVKKSSRSSRLVTAFAEVGQYARPQPSLMPDVDSTLCQIARWKFITTDFTSAFYQIPLSKGSMKYCDVVTPFLGVRVYAQCAMGMPGSETLEELMCRVLGDLLEEGAVAKIADDLYCGGDDEAELLYNWERLLSALDWCDLRLSASKTVIAPKSTTIHGWIWSNNTLRASPHRISTLSSSTPVKGLRSFIGAYKVLAQVIKGCSQLLSPLDDSIAGKSLSDKIVWSDDLLSAFNKAKSALSTNKSIVLPKPTGQLWVVANGVVKNHGLGATLYVSRGDSKPKLAGFFGAKLRGRQHSWIPCEVEALSIASAVKHFSPYVIESHLQACVLTDNKPCVQAYGKLSHGELSTGARVSTFLTAVSHYQVFVRHLSGSANLP